MITPASVKQIRSRGRVTQTQLAALLDVTGQTVSNWESRRDKPGVHVGAILLRLHAKSRNPDFVVWLAALLINNEVQRSDRRSPYLRMCDLLTVLFREGES